MPPELSDNHRRRDGREPVLVASRDGGFKGRVDVVLGWTLVVLMGLSVVNVLWQVFTRFVLKDPSAFTDEAARFLLIWVGLLGAAYAAGQKMHLAIDLLPQALARRRNRRPFHLVGMLIEALIFMFAVGAMVYGGANLVRLTTLLGQHSAALGAPLGAVYSVLPFSGGLIAFYAALTFIDHIHILRGGAPALVETTATGSEVFIEQEGGLNLHEDRPASPKPPSR